MKLPIYPTSRTGVIHVEKEATSSALLILGAGLPIAAVAQSPRPGAPTVKMLTNDECWGKPSAEKGTGQASVLPARALATAMPMHNGITTAGRLCPSCANPLDPKLRAEMAVAAHANHCSYAEEYALADGRRRAGLDEKRPTLRRGDYSGNLPAEKILLEFARKMTVSQPGHRWRARLPSL